MARRAQPPAAKMSRKHVGWPARVAVAGAALSACVLALALYAQVAAEFRRALRAVEANSLLPALHPDADVACSACEAVVGILAEALHSPGSPVEEGTGHGAGGESPAQRKRRTALYIGQLLDIVCSPPTLSQLHRRTGWLGAVRFELDSVPSFHPTPPVDPDLDQVTIRHM